MAVGPQTHTLPVVRQFTRDAYDRYRLLKQKLLDAGHDEVDIVLRLDASANAAAKAPSSPVALDFFGYVLVCEVTRRATHVQVRIVMLAEVDAAT